jgi:ribokinase
MITILGSLNTDLIIRVDQFPRAGETLYGRDFQTACGGKGANQAYAVARMGGQARMIGCVGDDDFGSAMMANLQNVGVETSGVMRRSGAPSGVALITLDADGQNQIIVAAGANATLSASDVEGIADVLRRSQAVITQLETTLPAAEAALRIAHEAGVRTVFNPAPYAPIPERMLALCDFVIPNESEVSKLVGMDVHDADTARTASQMLKAKGVRNVLVTLGAQGVWVDAQDAAEGFVGSVPAYAVKAVDTVAAGDAFIGAFVTRLCEGADVRSAAQFGCAASAIAVTRPGAQPSIPTRAEVTSFLEERGREK